MKHLIICREYPPAPSGGIGTYTSNIVQQLLERGETVHVIGQLWRGAEQAREERLGGRCVIHRLPLQDWEVSGRQPRPEVPPGEARALFASCLWVQSFAWQAGVLAELLIEQEGIDVVEAPDYEAPLYYLQLRRALGLGPARMPPLLVHLHSPTELIAHYDDWDPGRADVVTAKRLEHYSVRAADALLCPSHFLARQAESLFSLEQRSVEVIPYPIGDVARLDRDQRTWKQGSICYVGRLERRKGVLEWIRAAVVAATQNSELQFEFIGANILGNPGLGADEVLERLIPTELRRRFAFHGKRGRADMLSILHRARIAVVPSRWDNFPNACIEAMASGLPIIASPGGGMAEMVEDGRTGWLAESACSDDLWKALRRAVETPPETLARMGSSASESIRRKCDNRYVLDRHLDFKRGLRNRCARNSLRLPSHLSWSVNYPERSKRRESRPGTKRTGCGIVVVLCAPGSVDGIHLSLKSIDDQDQPAAGVVVVVPEWLQGDAVDMGTSSSVARWVVRTDRWNLATMKNRAIEVVACAGIEPLGFTFLRPGDCIDSGFLASCGDVLQRLPEVGIVSTWTRSQTTGAATTGPCPGYLYQLLTNEVSSPCVVRAAAILDAGCFDGSLDDGYEEWDAWSSILAAGSVAVTYPKILARCGHDARMTASPGRQNNQRFRQTILERNQEGLAPFAAELIRLLDTDGESWVRQASLAGASFARSERPPWVSSRRLRSLLRQTLGGRGRRLIRSLFASLRAFGAND